MLKEYFNNYFGKIVRVSVKDGRTLVGKFETIDRPYDNGYNEWSIGIAISDICIEEVLESEIKSIEEVTE